MKSGSHTHYIIQGICHLYNSGPEGFLTLYLRYHIPIAEGMSDELKAYAIENNKYPSGWRETMSAAGIDPKSVDQSVSYLSYDQLRLAEDKKFIEEQGTGFIIVDGTPTSILANFKQNDDRPAIRLMSLHRGPQVVLATTRRNELNLNNYSLRQNTQKTL